MANHNVLCRQAIKIADTLIEVEECIQKLGGLGVPAAVAKLRSIHEDLEGFEHWDLPNNADWAVADYVLSALELAYSHRIEDLQDNAKVKRIGFAGEWIKHYLKHLGATIDEPVFDRMRHMHGYPLTRKMERFFPPDDHAERIEIQSLRREQSSDRPLNTNEVIQSKSANQVHFDDEPATQPANSPLRPQSDNVSVDEEPTPSHRENSNPTDDKDIWMGAIALGNSLGVHPARLSAFRAKLDRMRNNNELRDDVHETDSPRMNESNYIYRKSSEPIVALAKRYQHEK